MSVEHNRQAFRELIDLVVYHGDVVSPRGHEIKELRNTTMTVDPVYPFQGFMARKYSLNYFIEEMRWMLRASRFDESIKSYAKMWESVQNQDKSFNSNYGVFWFGPQMGLMKAALELIRDKDSRRAVVPMLRDEHLAPHMNDIVCTEAMTFLIRNDTLHLTVHMRSSDIIFGVGTDIPTFSAAMLLVYGLVRDNYPNLKLGMLTLQVASSHLYSRHYEMASRILQEPPTLYDHKEALCLPSAVESMQIIADRGRIKDNFKAPSHWGLYELLYRPTTK